MDFIVDCIKEKITVQNLNGELRPIDELQLEYAAVTNPPDREDTKTLDARINSYMRKYSLKQLEERCKEFNLSVVDDKGKPLAKRRLAASLIANKQ
ncbi:hypothetical protein ECIV_ORF14 [European chub iridovirus]|nr:hypothetical protein ECIV_ORF14 [European chub iridovirus]